MPLTAEEIRIYIREAASIRIDIEPRVKDAYSIKENKEILYYAVDTNTVKLYTAPKDSPLGRDVPLGPDDSLGRKGKNYTGIFSKTNPETVYAFEKTVSEYIFFHLTKELPLLQIPPHEDETLRLFQAKMVSIKDQIDDFKFDGQLLKAFWEEYKTSSNREKLKANLKKCMPEFIRFSYGGTSSFCELKRFKSLLNQDRLLSFSYIIQKYKYKDMLDVSIFHPPSTEVDSKILSDYQNLWFNNLYDKKNGNRKGDNYDNLSIHTDANVLARLEWINDKLSKRNQRLILITRDEKLLNASYTHKLDNGSTFGDFYVRHPRAFIADRLFLNDVNSVEKTCPQSSQFDLVRWLKFLLASFTNFTSEKDYIEECRQLLRKSDKELEDLARTALKKDPSVGEGFLEEWEHLVEAIALRYSLDKEHTITEDKAANDIIEKFKGNDDIDKLIEEMISSAWNNFLAVGIRDGMAITHSDKNSTYLSRNVPIVRFLNKRYAKEYVESFLSTEKTVLNYDLDKILTEDESRYSYYLAFAVLYASAGKWQRTYDLAKMALEISKTKKIEGVYGYEAAYVVAVSLRRISKRIRDLVKVNEFLDIAENYIQLCAQEQTDQRILPDYRFKNERIALSLSYWLYRFFAPNTGSKDELKGRMSLIECEKEFLDLLPAIIRQCEKEGEVIWRSLKLQVISNLFMVVLINKFKKGQDSGHIDELKSYLETFDSFINGEKKQRREVQISFSQRANFFAMGCWLYENEKKQEAKSRLIELLDNFNIRKNLIQPYDKQRYKFLLEIAN